MRNAEFENLIFLGTGASQAEIANLGIENFSVLQGDLLKSYFSLTTSGTRRDSLSRFFQSFFGIDTDNPDVEYPTFEETLALVELSILRNEEIVRGINSHDIRRQLVYAISHTLAKSLQEVGGDSFHNHLLKRLKNESLLEHTAFLSLNYDIIIDNAILRFGGREERRLFPDYGFYIPRGKQGFKFERDALPLYKLHGSLNWLFCPVCNSIYHLSIEKLDSRLAEDPGYHCASPNCNEVQEPVLIPPTYLKDISNPFLKGVWVRTQKVLRNVKRIYFCGYSLPDADIQIKHFLKTLQLNRTLGEEMKVYIASKGPGGRTDSFANYERFFGPNVATNLNMSFQEFVNQVSFQGN